MANIAEPLELTVLLLLEIKKGNSVRVALHNTLSSLSTDFSKEVGFWLIQHQQGKTVLPKTKSAARLQIFQLLNLGLTGVPILEPLSLLKDQMLEICYEDVEAQVDRLPTLMTFPLILCFLPAFWILILGPVIQVYFLVGE